MGALPVATRTAIELALDLQEGIMAKTPIRAWDAAEHLATAEAMAEYLEAALEDGDPQLVAAALGDIARAKGMARVARDAGLGRESLYKALSSDGNPELATVLKVVRALGLRLHAAPAPNVPEP
jgi:probable addiction module antidote protein